MQLPYVTHCYRAVVRHDELPPEKPVTLHASTEDTGPLVPEPAPHEVPPPEDPGMQLIDFR